MTNPNKRSGRQAYRGGVGIAITGAFLTVWTTIVRDDGSGIGHFMLLLAIAVGWFSAWFEAAGMARTMFGVAVMQVLHGLLVATAPITAATPDGPLRALLFDGFFAVLWLLSAALFRIAAKRDRETAATR